MMSWMLGLGLSVIALAQEAEVEVDHRAEPPVVTSPVAIELPDMETGKLSNGSTLYFLKQKGLRKATLSVRLLRGHLDLDEEASEIRNFHGGLMTKATRSYSSEELELLTNMYDIDLRAWHSYRDSGVRVSVPNEDLSTGFTLLTSVLLEPSFPGREVKLRRQEVLRYYETSGPASPGSVANNALSYSWFDPEGPYGMRPDLDEVDGIRPGALKKRHKRLLETSPTEFLLIADMTLEEAIALLNPLAEQLVGPGTKAPLPVAKSPEKTRVIAVDMPESKQVQIRFRIPGPLLDDADRSAVQLANWALGGHFMSRLNRNLREEKGLTYGVYSRLVSRENRAYITVSVDVAKDNAKLAVDEILTEFRQLGENGLTAMELEDAQVSNLTDWNTALQTSESTAAFYEQLRENGWSMAEVWNRMEDQQRLGLEAVNRAAKEWFVPKDAWNLILVGSRKDIESQFPSEAYPIQWSTPEDAILGSI